MEAIGVDEQPVEEAIGSGLPQSVVRRVVERLLRGRRIPRATYRLQLNRHFTFQQARAIVPYLDALGISDIYASPYLQAHPESTHGYDINNHNALSPAIGTPDDYDALVEELLRRGMGQILDMVPNHMGIAGNDNRWWQDVLENGRASLYASYFDIDWEPLRARDMQGRVLVPFLGGPYGRVLESGELKLCYEGGAFRLDYWGRYFPIDPQTYALILQEALEHLPEPSASGEPGELADLAALVDPAAEARLELQSIITAARNLPDRLETDPGRLIERAREKEVVKRRLAHLMTTNEVARAAVEAAVAAYHGTPGDPASFDRLDTLLRQQAYRLAYWRVAGEEINYRRFFDVNELAGIRVELPQVFRDTHRLVLRLLAEGKITGLRIDHPDGLWDPLGYLRTLQRHYVLALVRHELARVDPSAAHDAPDEATEAAWLAQIGAACARQIASAAGGTGVSAEELLCRPLYVVVEKILSRGEPLPAVWPCDGTTGYDFANSVTGLFVDPAAESAFDEIFATVQGEPIHYRKLVANCKKLLMLVAFPGDINELGDLLKQIASRSRWHQDFTLNGLTFAVREVIAALPRYRTYRICDSGAIDPGDRAAIEAAIDEAIRQNRRTARAIFEFIRDLLLLEHPERLSPEDHELWCRFLMTFQQTTGPVMAKGVEDTAFYLYNRLVSLNEVGGNPDVFGTPPARFHAECLERRRDWPHALLATSTHDTKRGEDVRARIDVLSEIPREWRSALARFRRLNRRHLTRSERGEWMPDANDEYLLYQTLLGAWPLEGEGVVCDDVASFRERVQAYMLKATREAKAHTNWINPNETYERAVTDFVAAILDPKRSRAFLQALRPLREKVAFYGMLNGLGQALLKLTAPGVPDIYQGSELWNLSLVDPDNRRPVDYALRQRLLDELRAWRAGPPERRADLIDELLRTWRDGRIKLWLTLMALDLRRRRPHLFAEGDYLPLEATAPRQDHVVAFARRLGEEAAIVATPRLAVRLTRGSLQPPLGEAVWGETRLRLPPEVAAWRLRNVLTGELYVPEPGEGATSLRAADLFARSPCALLERIDVGHD